MKKIWPSVACSAVFLSGCMYGSATAPISALNNTPNQYNQYQQMRAPVAQVQPGQTIALTPSRVSQPRPAVVVPRPTQPQQIQPPPMVQPPQQAIAVQQQSPYVQPAVVQPARPQQSNDGWSVSPQQAPTQSSVTPVQTQDNNQNTQQANSQPQPSTPEAQPLRPSQSQTSTVSNNNTSSNAQEQQVASARPPQQPATPAREETAVSALLKKASASLGKGDLDGAAAYLENAQRIEPQNAKILYDIANIRYHQGRYKDAENFAGKAVQVGGGNSMMKKSWALVANARKSLGDNQGAIAAAEKAASFGN